MSLNKPQSSVVCGTTDPSACQKYPTNCSCPSRQRTKNKKNMYGGFHEIYSMLLLGRYPIDIVLLWCHVSLIVSVYYSWCTLGSHSPDIIHVTSIPTLFATFPFPCVIVNTNQRKMGEQGYSHVGWYMSWPSNFFPIIFYAEKCTIACANTKCTYSLVPRLLPCRKTVGEEPGYEAMHV